VGADRRYPELPMVGVGAVLLSSGLDEVLLIKRAAQPAQGLWSFPGGLVHAGETLRSACAREVEEETGLIADLRDVAKVVERIIPDADNRTEYHFVIVDFWGLVQGGELAAASDAQDARWTPLERVAAWPTTRGVPEAVSRAVQLARGEAVASPLFEASVGSS
jgi:8-oxo-dGTP diphosphatase